MKTLIASLLVFDAAIWSYVLVQAGPGVIRTFLDREAASTFIRKDNLSGGGFQSQA